MVKSDIQATQAEAATPNAGQQTNLSKQPEAEIAPAPAPQAITADAPPRTDAAGAPLPEVTTPSTGASMATVAASGLVAVPTAQTPASGDTSAQNPAPTAPKAAAKLATIAKADGDSASLPSPATGILPDIAAAPLTGISDAAGLETSGPAALGSSSISFASMAPGTPQQPAPAGTVLAAPFASPGPVLVAVPAEIVDIVSKTAEDGQSDRVVVQLDPPELGRVSIDFKFDAQGVQHVIITSETPEAMRQLRQMHSELVQALERQGVGSQNMTFQHQQQSQQQSPQANPLLRMAAPSAGAAGASLMTAIQPQPSSPQLSAGGRLDIRL